MKKAFAILSISLLCTGCSISSTYVPSIEIQRNSTFPNEVEVYYGEQNVPFKYKEIGRVFLNNVCLSGQDAGEQIQLIKVEAAKSGADAVILQREIRREQTYSSSDGRTTEVSGDVQHFSGIAIIRQ